MSGAPPKDQATVSVVIPTFQRRDLVLAAVRSLKDQTPRPPDEIIVVVDGSTDGTAEALRTHHPDVRVIEQANAGAAFARNAGATAARSEIVLFLDDDMEAEPSMVRHHILAHADGADAVLGHMPLHPQSPPSVLVEGVGAWAEGRLARLDQPDAALELHDLLTGQLSVKASVFAAIHGFDDRFTHGGAFGNEDIDLGLRLLRGGYAIRFVAEAISWQRYSVTPEQHLRQWRSAGRADVAFARKHPLEAAAIFEAAGARSAFAALVARPLARLGLTRHPGWLRRLALAAARQPGRLSRRVFFAVRTLEYWAGVEEAGGAPMARTVTVLAYHAISDLSASKVLAQYGVPPQGFAAQLDALKRAGCQLISPAEFDAFIQGKAGLPRKAVLVTFDDAYCDIAPAIDLLAERGAGAVVFAVSGQLGGANDWDAHLGAPRLPLMDAEALGRLQRSGAWIGAHSRSHVMLDRADEAGLAVEVEGSLDELEAAGLGRPRYFAYPYGASNAAVRQRVQAAGLHAAFSIRPGLVTRRSDLFDLPRIEVLRSDTGDRLPGKVRWARPVGWAASAWNSLPAGVRRRIEAISARLARLSEGGA